MRKIKGIWERNRETGLIEETNPIPESQWVRDGEGVATKKWDGTACMIRNGRLYKRYDGKVNKETLQPIRPLPEGFEPCQAPDPNTGHQPGWLLVGDGPEDKWHREVLPVTTLPDGTYELIGPRISSNKEGVDTHQLKKHGDVVYDVPDRSFAGIRAFLEANRIEGIVFHHPDGRMVKITRNMYGLPWGEKRRAA